MNSNEIPLVMPISGSGRDLNKDERSGFNYNRVLTFASAGLITGAAVGYLGYTGYTGYKDYTDYKDIQEYLNKQIGKYIQIKDVEMPPAPPPSPASSASSSSFDIRDLDYFD